MLLSFFFLWLWCLALEPLSNSLCGPRTEMFGDPGLLCPVNYRSIPGAWVSLPTKCIFCDCYHDVGHFLCGVEREKRFVKVHLHCIVSNSNIISKMSTLPLSGKISADAHSTPMPWILKRLSRWIMKTRQSKCSFALAHPEVKNKPYVDFHKPAYITSHAVCEKKTA